MLRKVLMSREKTTYVRLLFEVFVGPFCVQMCVRVSKIVNVIQFLFKINAQTLAFLSLLYFFCYCLLKDISIFFFIFPEDVTEFQ